MKTILLWPTIAACTLLAACGGGSTSGGGGVGSTPTPPPAPGPTPGPTPPPTPTPTNVSLLNLVASETFTSNATVAAASFTPGGATGTTAGSSALTVRYDLASRSYTVSNGPRSQTFLPSDRASGTAATNTYVRKSGPTTDSLTLTRPATSGVLTYEYVGAGFWERAVEQGNAVQGSFDAFTYGIETPDAALPRTGGAAFDVDLIGVLGGYEVEPLAMSGAGSLLADFVSGRVSTQGRFDLTRPSSGPTGNSGVWEGTGQLSSSANLFSGDFRLRLFAQLDGRFDGRFYGPGAQEVGAAYWARDPSGQISSGTLTGRRSPFQVAGQRLEDLDRDSSYSTTSAFNVYETASNGIVHKDGFARLNNGSGATSFIEFDADTGRYSMRHQLVSIDGTGPLQYRTVSFGPADRAADQSDPRFTTYRVATDGGQFVDVQVYRANSTKPELVLSYTSFARFAAAAPGPAAGVTVNRIDYVPFGLVTPADQIPNSGSASYTGKIHGLGTVTTTASSGTQTTLYTLGGTSRFQVDFLNLRGTLTLAATGTHMTTGAARNMGEFTYSVSTGGELRGSIFDTNKSGNFSGHFYGPRADEFGGTFSAISPNSNGTGFTSLTGITVGKRN